MNRLAPLVEAVPLGKTGQFARRGSFVVGGHRQVRVLPVAEDAETLELLALDFDPFLGVSPALLADLGLAHLALSLAEFLVDLQFDRQTVAVPARHVRGVEALHTLALDDDILEDLVQRVADMNVAVGIGRAIVQGEVRFTGGRFADFAVQFKLSPALHDFRFALWQVAAHREISDR